MDSDNGEAIGSKLGYVVPSLTRVELLKVAAGGALGAATLGVGPDTASARQLVTSLMAATPKRGGTLRFSSSGVPTGFDPARWFNSVSQIGSMAVCETLVTWLFTKPQGTVAPLLLAQLPTPNKDRTVWTFRLRSGVKFHHGREMTADDVKFSLSRLMSPATKSEASSLYTSLPIVGMAAVVDEKARELRGIKVINNTTFTISFDRPDSAFLYLFGLPFAAIVPRDVVTSKGLAGFNFAPVGTGPFKARNVNPDRGMTLERNASYWRRGRPYIDRVSWTFGVEPTLAVLRILRGEQDLMAEDVPLPSYLQLRSDASAKPNLIVASTTDVRYATLSLKHEATRKLGVRQAIAHAIDKRRLVSALQGLAEAASGGLFGPRTPYFQPGLAYPYNPERAKQLLTQAGYPTGFKIKVFTNNGSPNREAGLVIAEDLRRIGIDVDLEQPTFDIWVADVVKNLPVIGVNNWDLPYPHGSFIIDPSFTKKALDAGCCNFSAYQSDQFDRAALRGHLTFDTASQVELYKKLDKTVTRDRALWLPLVYTKSPMLKSRRLKGLRVPPIASWKLFDEYWLG